MKSLRELYKIGRGPSSSHTMGPEKAAKLFEKEFPDADGYKVILYDSLAKTGKGHMTDWVIQNTFSPKPCEIVFDKTGEGFRHPNTMDMFALKNGETTGKWRVYSVGGGTIEIEGRDNERETPDVYPHRNFTEIADYCEKHDMRLWEYVEMHEGEGIWEYLEDIWFTMRRAIKDGLGSTGVLPGGLELERKARILYKNKRIDESAEIREDRLICAYAFAVSEQNASAAGDVVTAPTCGACGVMPAVLQYVYEKNNLTTREILRGLAAGGIIGNVIKTNASVSGAECGCQAEVGSACCMAAAALAEIYGLDLDQIEYSAEIAMEHHLGLTCDPIKGLVQIPCIERNAVAAMRAMNAVRLANFLTHTRKISFDMVVETMYRTGKDMPGIYRETSEGGLAKLYP